MRSIHRAVLGSTAGKLLARLGIMVAGIVLFLLVSSLVQLPLHRNHVPDAIGASIAAVSLIFVYWAIQKLLERRNPRELRIVALPLVIAGLAFGVALFATTIGILASAHIYVARYAGITSALFVTALLTAIAVAVAEELLFRGFLYRTLRDLFGVGAGVVVSALLFGLAHAFNPGATIISTIAVAIEAGILLSVAYEVSNTLWLPVGIHAGWNFAEASIFGTSVSGGRPAPSILAGTLNGPALLSGGAFGPEASIVAVVVCLAAVAVLVKRGSLYDLRRTLNMRSRQ